MRLIDADRLLDRCKFYHLPNGDLAVPIIDVQHAPTIEPERKKGEWIDQDDGAYYPVECSECRKIPLFDVYGDYILSNFCPNCGADMKGDNDA